MDKLEEEVAKEVIEKAAAHMKMVLTSQISSITLKIQNGLHYQTIPTTISTNAKEENENQLTYQIITGVQNSIHHKYGLARGVIRFRTNGIRTQVSAENRRSAFEIRNEPEKLSVLTYNHIGNCITRS